MSSITNPDSVTAGFGYDNGGRVTTISRPGSITCYGYNARDWLQQVVNYASGGGYIYYVCYCLGDNVGNPLYKREYGPGGVSYALTVHFYDNIRRLTREVRTGTGPYDISYSYDAVGNRTGMTRNGTAYTYVYDDNNKLTSASGGGTNAYFYYNPTGTPGNVTGNMLGSWTLWYNEENRLIQVTYPPSGVTDTFTYNWAGLRTRATLAGTTYRYLYNGERVLEELTDGGAMTARYTTENGNYYGQLLHLKRATGESRFPLYDAAGDVERLVDGSATVTDNYTLDSFGRQLGGTAPTPNPYRFGGAWGYITDPSGLLQLGARFYWPELGRFLQRDRVRREVNLYSYALDNPLQWIDPKGLDVCVPYFTWHYTYPHTTFGPWSPWQLTQVTFVELHILPYNEVDCTWERTRRETGYLEKYWKTWWKCTGPCGPYSKVTESAHNRENVDRDDRGVAKTWKYGWIDADEAAGWCLEHPPG